MSPGSSSGASSSITSSTAGPALTMIMILRGVFSAPTSSLTDVGADDLLSLGPAVDELVDLRRRAVEDGHGVAVALHVQDEVLAHHGQADQADVGGLAAVVAMFAILIRRCAGIRVLTAKIVTDPERRRRLPAAAGNLVSSRHRQRIMITILGGVTTGLKPATSCWVRTARPYRRLGPGDLVGPTRRSIGIRELQRDSPFPRRPFGEQRSNRATWAAM